MIELPESAVLSEQITATLKNRKISSVQADYSPHKFAWYYGEPSEYHMLLKGRVIESCVPRAGRVEVKAEGITLNFMDGVNLRFHKAGEKHPKKHQLLIIFEDGTALSGSVAMYGGLFAFPDHAFDDDFYYKVAKEKPSPLSDNFDYKYYKTLFDDKSPKMSSKAFLATKQRIPGLGNGVLQDILFNAGIHPKTKIETLSDKKIKGLYKSIKSTLSEMSEKGGRDTEKDLFGNYGGYATKLSKKTLCMPCHVCGSGIVRQAYLGGNVYFCPGCQPEV